MLRFSSSGSRADGGTLRFEVRPIALLKVVGVADADDVVAIALERLAYAIEAEFAADGHIRSSVSHADCRHEAAATPQHLGLGPRICFARRQRSFSNPIRHSLAERLLQNRGTGASARCLSLDRIGPGLFVDLVALCCVEAAGHHLGSLMREVGANLNVEEV